MNDTTKVNETHRLLQSVLKILRAHREAFHQERTYRRGMSLVFGELFSFARHTVTQGLLALGLTEMDWSAFYRLFSRARFEEETLENYCCAKPWRTCQRRKPIWWAWMGPAFTAVA